MTINTTKRTVIEMVKVADLVLEPHAQREVNSKRAARIADNWNPLLVGFIKVAVDPVTEVKYIVDGGHRWTAAKIREIDELLAEVHYGLNKKERADLFLKIQQERVSVDKLTRYNVSLTAERQRETEIDTVLSSYDLKIAASPSTQSVAAIVSLQKVWDLGGASLVGATINALKSSFYPHYQGDAWQGDILLGTAIAIHRNPNIETKRLVITLKRYDPRTWMADITRESKGSGGSGGRPLHMARLLAGGYNSRLTAQSKRRITI